MKIGDEGLTSPRRHIDHGTTVHHGRLPSSAVVINNVRRLLTSAGKTNDTPRNFFSRADGTFDLSDGYGVHSFRLLLERSTERSH